MKKYIILLFIFLVIFLMKKEKKYILFLGDKSYYNNGIGGLRYSLYRKYNFYPRLISFFSAPTTEPTEPTES